jgi:hypothetical protein
MMDSLIVFLAIVLAFVCIGIMWDIMGGRR